MCSFWSGTDINKYINHKPKVQA